MACEYRCQKRRGDDAGVSSATSNIWKKYLNSVTSETHPTAQPEKCLGEERSEVIFVLENLWRDFSFGTLPERFDRVECG